MALLQAQLAQLGFAIAPAESKGKAFRETTARAVRGFQARLGLRVTGVVDEATARAVKDAVEALKTAPPRSSQPLSQRLVGRVTGAESGEPLAGLTVRALDLDAGDEPKDLGSDITNRDGLFSLSHPTGSVAKGKAGPRDEGRRLRLEIRGVGRRKLDTVDIRARPDDEEPLLIRVSAATAVESPSPAVTDLAKALGLTIPPELLASLSEHGIRTLADIRKAGGIAALAGRGAASHRETIKALEGHAILDVVSADARLNAALIGNGYTSLYTIARARPAQLLHSAGGHLDKFQAARMQAVARASSAFLTNVTMEAKSGKSNGLGPNDPANLPNTAPLFGTQCGCEDCEAAVSPLAYLADLLDYVLKHLTNDDQPITLGFLKNTFHQPFGDLPVSCAEMDKAVRQVRICTEVLRAYLKAKGLPVGNAKKAVLGEGEKRYRLAAYQQILAKVGTSYEEVRLARTADAAAREAVADRLGIALGSGTPDNLEKLFLDPAANPAIPESALESLFGLVDTTKPNPLAASAAAPQFLAWRLDHLRAAWKAQDRPVDPYALAFLPAEARFPVIDPDVTGPDDFREPFTKKNPGDPDQIMDVWLRRRDWVDARMKALASLTTQSDGEEVPDFDAIVASMYEDVDYGSTTIVPWLNTTAPTDFGALEKNLAKGIDLDATRARIQSDLGLTVESFTRVMEIRDKDQAAMSTAGTPRVKPEEWTELFSILVQAQKARLFPAWIAEEMAQHHVFGPDAFFGPEEFWISLSEPKEGDWPPVRSLDAPFIDPDAVKLADLPDPVVGKRARDLWTSRQLELEGLRDTLQSVREAHAGAADNGFDAVVREALGDPDPGDPLPNGLELEALNQSLASSDPATASAARQAVGASLFMSLDDFTRLMAVDAQAKPPLEEWNSVYAILTSAGKVKRLFPAWLSQEADPANGVTYWSARKAALPRWRASADARQQWRQALRLRRRPPLIDPDLIGQIDLEDPDSGPPFDLWTLRRKAIKDRLDTFAAQPKTAAGLDQLIHDGVGVTAAELKAIDELDRAGEDVTARLEQLTLAGDAFAHLLRIGQLVDSSPAAVLASEWEDVYGILAQVWKRRRTASWRAAEEAADVVLGPDQFAIPEPLPVTVPADPTSLPAWRADRSDRRDWQDLLQSRIDQRDAMTEALRGAVSATEGALLPSLRDALVMATDAAGTTLETKAKKIAEVLLLDASTSGCEQTTRVAQAIATLQDLVFSARTSQLLAFPHLALDAPDFDAEWEWMGSYATWRAAMFVFLYPENLLLPSLRKRPTPAFAALLGELRAGRRLTPEGACSLARDYAGYFRDVCRLTVEASCRARTRSADPDCGHREAGGVAAKDLFYMFARNPEGGAVYFSTRDHANAGTDAQSFWLRISALDKTRITELLAAVPYASPAEDHLGFIYLFVRVEDEDAPLVYLKYDLDKPGWLEDDTTELELPKVDGIDIKAIAGIVAVQRAKSSMPPTLIIDTKNSLSHHQFYARSLTPDGNGWEDPEDSGNAPEDAATNPWAAFKLIKPGMQGASNVVTKTLRSALQIRVHPEFPAGDFDLWMLCLTQDAARDQAVLATIAQGSAFATTHSIDGFLRGATPSEHGSAISIFGSSAGPYRQTANESGLGSAVTHTQNLISVVADHGAFPDPHLNRHLVQYLDYNYLPPAKTAFYDFTFETTAGAEAPDETWTEAGRARVAPQVEPVPPQDATPTFAFDTSEKLSSSELQVKRATVATWYEENAEPAYNSRSSLVYLEEFYYFVPVQLAYELQKNGYYTSALDWLRTAYDYAAPPNLAKIYHGLTAEQSLSAVYSRAVDWLLDPLDPHGLAATRRNSYTRFTLLSIVRCLLAFADAEFTRDTVESVTKARTLYLTALRLLDATALKQGTPSCDELIGTLTVDLAASQQAAFAPMKKTLGHIADLGVLQHAVEAVQKALASPVDWEIRLGRARAAVAAVLEPLPLPPTMADVMAGKADTAARIEARLLSAPEIAAALQRIAAAAPASAPARAETLVLAGPAKPLTGVALALGAAPRAAPMTTKSGGASPSQGPATGGAPPPYYVPDPSYHFCIPPNPIVEALRLHAELNLFKLRNCRNIAGMRRELEPYAGPTDTVSGLPMIGAGGQLVLPGLLRLPPTPYRYAVLVERAKNLVSLAQQIEVAFLSMLEKRDAEAYGVLKARQDVSLARAGVRLQSLRVVEAQDGVELASLVEERAQIQFDHYQELLQEGLSDLESLAIGFTITAAGMHIAAAAAAAATPGGGASALSSSASAASTLASVLSMYASHERQAEEWELQKNLAAQDIAIGGQQIKIAQDQVRVAGQERIIAQLQSEHAEAVVDFLSTKFTNVELYDWMSGVLERVYSFFLQQATSTAQLAANQLAFERQEVPPPFIQGDYWEAPSDGPTATEAKAPDRRGLTGSARLLQDIYQLDQYAFETNERKLQLSKTISLAQLAPVDFQRFRETGVMTFATPMELFDRDFPGHYLRLVHRIQSSVIALIPPMQGIRATFSAAGTSRVVIGGDVFQKVVLNAGPQSVALTSAREATGLFPLEQPSEMLRPFEGIGVDTTWELRLPKAANFFEYASIADVLLTVEYTALSSFDYYEQVIQTLKPNLSADRPFSFRHQFADQWYDLHNPDQTASPMTVRFTTGREDFPPNLEKLKIQHVLLYFARASAKPFEVPVAHLSFTDDATAGTVGGGAASMDGLISTRRGNGGSWMGMLGKSPLGAWELALPNTTDVRKRFASGEIEDILFVVTYSGRVPDWPR